jgi:hypothetical protein
VLSRGADLTCCLLVDVTPDAIRQSPLERFQVTACAKVELRRLLTSVNDALGKHGERQLDERRLDSAFEAQWGAFEQQLESISKATYDDEVPDAENSFGLFNEKVMEAFAEWQQQDLSLEEVTVAVARAMQTGSDKLDLDGLAMLAAMLRVKMLPQLIAGGFVTRNQDNYALTESARAALADTARARNELKARLNNVLQRAT